ncbi:hypothetical protein SDC9_159805 [bioreactor metagenome]|uniref:Uncharacterized protein n=1 Tax=bioreactor metagenome TaxID=1076179 RepID=A0A645FDU7_9ZZZZ
MIAWYLFKIDRFQRGVQIAHRFKGTVGFNFFDHFKQNLCQRPRVVTGAVCLKFIHAEVFRQLAKLEGLQL